MPPRRKNSAQANPDHPELGLPEVRKLWQTEGLFSDHYLKARIRQNPWWPCDAEAQPIWEFCKALYEKRYVPCAKDNEAFTRQELLDKILEQVERRLIELALAKTKGHLTRAAEYLSIWRTRFSRVELSRYASP